MKKNTIKNTIAACALAGIITLGGTPSEAALGDRALYQGVNNSDVKELQQVLKDKNFLSIGNTTTYFGSITKEAVKKFQRANGLTADGSFGPASYRALKGSSSGSGSKNKPSVEPSRNDSGRGLGIDIVSKAKQYIGGRYVYGGTTPAGFDCTGFTQYIYKQFGVSIPRTTTSQATVGKSLSKSQLQVGDLIIFSNTYKAGPSHAGIYIGNGEFVHAANASKGIRVDSVNSSYYSGKFHSGRKLF